MGFDLQLEQMQRQFTTHGHVLVDGKKLIFLLYSKTWTKIEIKEKSKTNPQV